MIAYLRELTAAYAYHTADCTSDRADLFTLVGTFAIGALVAACGLSGTWEAF